MNVRTWGVAIAALGLVPGASAQYFIRSWVSTSPLTALINGATGTGISTSYLVADDLATMDYAGQRIYAINAGIWNKNPQSVSVTTNISVYASSGSAMGPTGVAFPGSLLVTRNSTSTLAANSTLQTTWFHSPPFNPINAFIPNAPIWIGVSFSGATAAELNEIGLFHVQSTPTSTPAIFKSDAPMIGNVSNPAGTQSDLTGIAPSGDLSVTIGVQPQTFRSAVTWATQPAAYSRRMHVVAMAGSKVLIDRTNTLSASALSGNFTFTVPATLPTGTSNPVTIYLDGESFLRRSVIGFVPVPAPDSTGPTINIAPVTLVGGDCDNSGEIDAADIDYVIARFGMMFTAAGGDSNADVDASGEVDAVDIDLVIANFGLTDDPMP